MKTEVNRFNDLPENSSKEELKCLHCEAFFSRKDNLTRHIKSVHLQIKENMCHLCDRQFLSKVELKDHQLVQDCNKKVFNCKICDAIFSRKSSLKSHIATFHNEIKGTKYDEPKIKRRCISKSIKEEL